MRKIYDHLTVWLIALLLPISAMADGSTRPDSQSGPTDIHASIVIVDLDAVQDAKQSFEASVFFDLSWYDSRLAGQNFTSANPQAAGIWLPQIGISNQQNAWPVMPTVLRIEDGTVTLSRHIWGSFSQPLDLLRFPFDIQVFRVSLVAASEPGELRFLQDPDRPSGITSSTSVPDWEFSVIDAAGQPFIVSEAIEPSASFVLEIRGERLSQYYIFTMILPLIVITAMSFVAFFIEVQSFATRVGVASTSMLTVVTYRVAASQILPRTNYFTDLDIFIAGSTVLVFVSLLTVVVIKVIEEEHLEQGLRIDKWARIGLPVGFAVFAFGAFS